MRFASTLFVLASMATSCLATVAQIEGDMVTIANAVHALHVSANAFPTSGGTLDEANAIHKDAGNLATAFNKGAVDEKATAPPVPGSDCVTILTTFEDLQPMMEDIFARLILLKHAFLDLPVGGVPALVKQDLINLCDGTEAFGKAFIVLCPSNEASELAANIKAGCDAIEAQYADV